MLGPWLQPHIPVDIRSPIGLISSDPAIIEFAVLSPAPYAELGVVGILLTCPSHRILPAFVSTVRVLGSSYSLASSYIDISLISCGLEVFWISAVVEKSIVCTIPLHNASGDFTADVVIRSNDRPKIAKLLYYREIVVGN